MMSYEERLDEIKSAVSYIDSSLDDIRNAVDKLEAMESLHTAASATVRLSETVAAVFERMESRRNGLPCNVPEEEDMQVLLDIFRRWRANR